MVNDSELSIDAADSANLKEVEMADSPKSMTIAYQDNENIRNLPDHLKQFIIDQQYDRYTPIDHAVWRYVMRQNYAFLKDNAHAAYVEGLSKTGIGIERLPSIEQMNEILAEIGWAAVTVDGFIPPAAFMEFQAHRVLVIAADVRQIDHIEYTPAPDIIHEAAGHAPIIADDQYAEYLRRFGEYGSKAISSRKDYELYEAIRHLSILKEASNVNMNEVKRAEKDVEQKQKNLGEPSEMALLSRLHWWTVEYGLIGDIDDPKIYGAGLLSSIGESSSCLGDEVAKLPYSLEAADYAFDITTKQPHLFIARDFGELIDVLEQFADNMAFRTGGVDGIKKGIECRNTCTCRFSSGLQLSGTFADYQLDSEGNPIYIRTDGPSALAYASVELEGHGKNYHKDGFGSPVGRLAGGLPFLESMTDRQLEEHDIQTGRKVKLEFASGVVVEGHLERILRREEFVILLSFSKCTVSNGDEILFDPAWGTYDMAVGETINSVFCGAADKDAFEQRPIVPRERTIKTSLEEKFQRLQSHYQMVRSCRESDEGLEKLKQVWKQVRMEYPDDWLLTLEILEMYYERSISPDFQTQLKSTLEQLAAKNESIRKLICDGLKLVAN